MKIFKTAALCATGFACMMLSACTISDPDDLSSEAAYQDLRLKSVTWLGTKFVDYQYDTNGRLTKILFNTDIEYRFTYDGTSDKPNTITTIEYDEYYNSSSDDYKLVESEMTVWKNISYNERGYISSVDYEEHNYSYTWDYEKQENIMNEDIVYTGTSTFVYNTNGNLIKQTFKEKDPFSGMIENDEDIYNWENGLLISNSEGDTFEYSDVDNTLGQWDPLNHMFGPLVTTNLLGAAPKKFMSGAIADGEHYQYSYSLYENGMIRLVKFAEGNEMMTFKFNYEKK